MNVTILSNFCGSFSKNFSSRFLQISRILDDSNVVELITSNFNHGAKKHFSELPLDFPFKITMLDQPAYQKNVSIRRFFAHYIWGRNVYAYLNTYETKPDVVYAAIPSLYAAALRKKCVVSLSSAILL